jgi:hypothetical protein
MTDEPLRPADPDELRLALSLALRQDGRRRFPHSSESMANITADHLIRCLEQANYIIMQKKPRRGHSTPTGPLVKG